MKNNSVSPATGKGWAWIPTLYFAEGLPYVMVMTVSVIMYKKLGISNTDISLFTSLLYLPWVIKPLWSPVVDMYKSKRSWITSMQLLITLGFLGVALALTLSGFFLATFIVFAIMAFFSATHDIAADGFYMLGLSQHDQSYFVGIRSLFYRISMIAGQGLLVIAAGFLEERFRSDDVLSGTKFAWMVTFFIPAALFFLFFLYHKFVLPHPVEDKKAHNNEGHNFIAEFMAPFKVFFKKDRIFLILGFLLFYRLGESQLLKLASPFLIDLRTQGGLGLTTKDVGFAYGTVGIICLVAGGLLGGYAISKKGLKFWLWWMLGAINIPHLLYVFLSFVQPESYPLITACVGLEQFGYGFGFTAYAMYMIYISDGEYKTSHYAICTGFMALGMMLPGMVSGLIQQAVGYKLFFVWVFVSFIPSFIIAKYIKIDPEFGRKRN
jgi:PAT family beta-lactamase induction signal transducer AmpG